MKKAASNIIPVTAMLLYGSILLILSYIEGMVFYFLWGSLFLISSSGLYFKKPWSQYIIYFMSFTVIAIWAYELGRVVLTGWASSELINNVWYIVNVLLIVVFYTCVSTHVFIYFRKLRRQT